MRKHNKAYRDTEYFCVEQVRQLITAAQTTGHEAKQRRNTLVIRLLLEHGLRSVECRKLKVSDINLKKGTIRINRAKGGGVQYQPLSAESIALFKAHAKDLSPSDYLFASPVNKGQPLGKKQINYIVKSVAERAGLNINAHAHMTRHTCGYLLANSKTEAGVRPVEIIDIAAHLAHKSVTSSLIYIGVSEERKHAIASLAHGFV